MKFLKISEFKKEKVYGETIWGNTVVLKISLFVPDDMSLLTHGQCLPFCFGDILKQNIADIFTDWLLWTKWEILKLSIRKSVSVFTRFNYVHYATLVQFLIIFSLYICLSYVFHKVFFSFFRPLKNASNHMI